MSKKSTYWTIGIIAAIVIIAVIWLLPRNSNTSKDTKNNTAAQNQDSADPATVTPAENGQDSAENTDNTGSGNNSGNNHDSHSNTTDNSNSQSADDNLTAYMEDQDRMMNQMMIDMENIPKSDHAATDFLAGMVPHHEAAVAMAESYLKYGGENEQLTKLANSIIETQTKEIEDMNSLMQEYHAAQKEDPDTADAHMEKYKEMFASHHMGHSTSADSVDAAFAEGMIEHHRMAVEMAENILEYTDEEDVINLANNIIATQKEEIEEMQSVLDNL
ncbi:MAG: DUF305 domain-containing protein [Eubacteriales bacterium]|nr:DUF305 domain-containing protein [Eubacteriales bacterium]